MSLTKPSHIKFRWEGDTGLIYDHENYGYEDATLTSADGLLIEVLEYVDEHDPTRRELEREFSPAVVEVMLDRGFLTHA